MNGLTPAQYRNQAVNIANQKTVKEKRKTEKLYKDFLTGDKRNKRLLVYNEELRDLPKEGLIFKKDTEARAKVKAKIARYETKYASEIEAGLNAHNKLYNLWEKEPICKDVEKALKALKAELYGVDGVRENVGLIAENQNLRKQLIDDNKAKKANWDLKKSRLDAGKLGEERAPRSRAKDRNKGMGD